VSSTHVERAAAVPAAERARLGRRAQLLAAASVSYNLVEGVVAVSAGLVAGSVALVGFGLDSAVEVSSGLVVLWQFRSRLPAAREQQALRLIALSFLALAGYVTVESVRALVTGAEPEAAPVGIALAVLSLLVMPLLARAQRRTGRALHSASVVADGGQTRLCAWMSAALLVGLALNALLGWEWADPLAGLVIAAIAVKEGRQTWRGEGCCAPVADTAPDRCGSSCCP
jgi:divalent metal cation (Fe/Co/Zn/Cd) transporter